MTTKVQVVFYSMYGHIYRLAEAIAAGAREVAQEVDETTDRMAQEADEQKAETATDSRGN